MIKFRVFALLLSAVAFSATMQETASATGVAPYGTGGFAYPGWFYQSSPYATGRIPTPPYFSIHPPVYYSAPVPRTYGYSPYAYPGTVRTPELEVSQKVAIIQNPFTSDKKNKKGMKTASSKARMIINPFVQSENTMLTSDVK